MAYADGDDGVLANVTHALRSSFVFVGRSRRTELGYYWLAMTFASQLIMVALFSILEIDESEFLRTALTCLFYIPLAGLVVRRLHDFNFSGYWALIFVGSIALRLLQEESGELSAPLSYAAPAVTIAAILLLFAIFVAPGTEGENRFGPNPRFD